MKLDPRIIEGKRPLTCFDSEFAKQFIGKKGFVTDFLKDFCNLNKIKMSELKNVWQNDTDCFVTSVTGYKYFLPSEWVKPEKQEIKWRPFTLDEFIDRFDLEVGTRAFLIRYKTTHEHQKRLLLTGLIHDTNPGCCGVCLGGFQFTFSDLFDMFDVRFGEKDWQPFGVEEASE